MGSEMVMVDDVAFPPSYDAASARTLDLLGHGITDIEIHFLQIKFTAIGIYLDKDIANHLKEWKGKSGEELISDEAFWQALISAPVGKVLRIVVIKEIKGSQYGVQLESAVRERLVDADKYDDDEEAALEAVIEFFQSKYFKKDSVITFQFDPAEPATSEVSFAAEGKEEVKLKISNANVAGMILKWYLGGGSAVSPTTVASLARNLAVILDLPAEV